MKIFKIFLVLLVLTIPGCASLPQNEHHAIERLLPPETTGLLVLKMNALSRIPLFQELIEDEFLDSREYEELKEKYHFDLTREISLAALALTSSNPIEADFTGVLLLFLEHPRPDIFELILAEEDYSSLEPYRGVPLFEDEEEFVFAFLENRVLLGGTREDVKKVIDSYRGGNTNRGSTLRYIFKNKNEESIFWGGMLTPGSIWEDSEDFYPGIGSLDSIENMAFSVDLIDQTTYIRLNLESRDQGFNKKIVDLLNGLMVLGRLADQNRELSELFDNLSFEQEPDGFTMLIKMTEELLSLIQELDMEEYLETENLSSI